MTPPVVSIVAKSGTGKTTLLEKLIGELKRRAMPKIEVHRLERSPNLLCRGEERDPTLFAVASDEPLQLDVPVFHLNDVAGLCDLIASRFLA